MGIIAENLLASTMAQIFMRSDQNTDCVTIPW